MWFIGVEVEQETSAPPPKKIPGSAPANWPNITRGGVMGNETFYWDGLTKKKKDYKISIHVSVTAPCSA